MIGKIIVGFVAVNAAVGALLATEVLTDEGEGGVLTGVVEDIALSLNNATRQYLNRNVESEVDPEVKKGTVVE